VEECRLVLSAWPETADQSFIEKLQEANTEMPATFQELGPHEADRQLIRMVSCRQVPGRFQPSIVTDYAIDVMDKEEDVRDPAKELEIVHSHIPDHFLSAVAPWDPPNTPVMNTQDTGEMLQLCALLHRRLLLPLCQV
jgi:hypothetical protein